MMPDEFHWLQDCPTFVFKQKSGTEKCSLLSLCFHFSKVQWLSKEQKCLAGHQRRKKMKGGGTGGRGLRNVGMKEEGGGGGPGGAGGGGGDGRGRWICSKLPRTRGAVQCSSAPSAAVSVLICRAAPAADAS